MSEPTADYEMLRAENERLRQELNALKSAGPAAHGAMSKVEHLRDDALFAAVYDDARHIAGIVNPDGTIRHANRMACELVGCVAEDVVGQLFWEAPWWRHSPEEQQRVREAVFRAARGEFVQFETTHPAADGCLRQIDFTLRPVKNREGRVLGLVSEGRDITVRRQTENDLEAIRSLLEATLEQSPVPLVVVTAPDLTARFRNRAALSVLGMVGKPSMLNQSLAEVMRRKPWKDLHPDGTPIEVDDMPMVKALRGETVFAQEVCIEREDGTRRWVLMSGTPVYSPAGHLIAGLIVFPDITERKENLEKFQNLAKEQRTILDTITTGLCHFRRRKLKWANRAFGAMFGYEPREIEGADARMLYFLQEDYDRVGNEGYRRLAEGGIYTTELQARRADGTAFWCALSGQAINPQDMDEGSIWLFQDVSERRQAEEALLKSQEHLELALEGAGLGSWDWNIQNGTGSVSERLASLLGYNVGEISRTPEKWEAFIHPDDLAVAREARRRHFEGQSPTYEAEVRLRHRSGAWVWVLDKGKIISRDAEGRPLRAAGTILDISQRKNAEHDRSRLQEQLQQATKMEAVGRLAGGVAHDFNNILTVITGNVELARTGLDSADPLAQCLSEISDAAASAATLTRQLLAFSRRQIIQPRIVNLNDLVGGIHKMITRLIGEDVVLQTALAPDLGSVRVDPGQFDQVLVNLAVNARDAMPEGGRLIIGTANVALDEAYCADHADVSPGPYVLLSVSDTGCGLSEEAKRRLFEPFFTTKPKGRGTGLGLAMIYGAVKQSGGVIEVYSELGQGTSFKIYLPRIEMPAERLTKPTMSSELPKGTGTVLLVEDETSVRELATRILKRLGYQVLPAPNGGEAFMIAEKHRERIDLCLTDVVMPGMNGRDLAERVRKLHPEMKVLFTSGYTEDVIVHHGVVDEGVNFISKPYTVDGLAKKVRQVLGPS